MTVICYPYLPMRLLDDLANVHPRPLRGLGEDNAAPGVDCHFHWLPDPPFPPRREDSCVRISSNVGKRDLF